MKIALLAPAWFAVPPVRYGGIEWVVSHVADGLVDRGHDVTLFAAGDSQTKATLATSYDEPPSYRIGLSLPDLHHALTCLERAGEFDVVNDHSGPLACASITQASGSGRVSGRCTATISTDTSYPSPPTESPQGCWVAFLGTARHRPTTSGRVAHR